MFTLFAWIFRAMRCKAVRIKLLRRPVGRTIPPRFPCQVLIFVFSSPVVVFDDR
jgi:hypothetical protein